MLFLIVLLLVTNQVVSISNCSENPWYFAVQEIQKPQTLKSPVSEGNWPIYVINPDHLKRRWSVMQKMVPKATRIPGSKFPQNITQTQKHYIITQHHRRAWIQAYNDTSVTDGVVFLEDDVILINNWRGWLARVLENPDVHIVRFDSLPYEYTSDSDSLISHIPLDPWCLGGYYLTKEALGRIIEYTETIEYSNFKKIEELFDNFRKAFYNQAIRTTTPRLAIQNWWANRAKSNVQSISHQDNLKNMQNSCYLPKYKHWYSSILKYDVIPTS